MEKNDTSRISSEGMDTKINKKKWTPKRIAFIIGGVGLVVFVAYSFAFLDSRSSLNVDRDKITISTVQQGSFQKFIQETGNVQPIQTIYLDAVEGGVVEDIYKESGAMVRKGDTLLKLSNSDLRLSVMQQTSSIYDQINQTRNSRLNIEQNSLSLKERLANAENELEISKSNFERKRKLYNQDMIAEQQFLETKENYEYAQKRYNLIYESFKQDSIKANQQLHQVDASLERMWKSLEAVQGILDRLVVLAPIEGQLSTIELNPGQSISSGERIGQIDILNNYKVRVGIDEYYLSQITRGLQGTFEFNGESHELEITKVFPVVENGQFQVDMEFIGEMPSELTRGQTVRIRLELGSTNKALLLTRGGFYQKSGGNWVYKITENGEKAVKQPVSLGRQNPDYYEVLSGLELGDKVITSDYKTFGENEVLNLE